MPWSSSCTHFNNYMATTNTTSTFDELNCFCACDDMWRWFLLHIRNCANQCEHFNWRNDISLWKIQFAYNCCRLGVAEWQFQSDLFVINFFQFSISLHSRSYSNKWRCAHTSCSRILIEIECVPLRLWPLLNTLRDNEISINWPNVVRNWSKYGKLTHSHSN